MGKLTPTQAAKYARLSTHQSAGMKKVAALGTRAGTNVERDLHRRLKCLSSVEPMLIRVPIKDVHKTGKVEMDLACLAPYEIFSELYRAGWGNFEASMLGPSGAAAATEFWDHSLRCSWGRAHQANNALFKSRSKLIPLSFFSDGIAVYTNRDFNVFLMKSQLVWEGDVMDVVYFIAVLETILMTPATRRVIANFEIWNMRVLEGLIHPPKGFDRDFTDSRRIKRSGTLIASGWGATFSSLNHDIVEETKLHMFQRNYLCNFLCKRCLGNRHLDVGCAYNMSASRDVGDLLCDHAHYLATTPFGQQSVWVNEPSWTIERNIGDGLHMMWLGVGKDLGAQLLDDLVVRAMYMDSCSYDDALAWHYTYIKQLYKRRGCHFGAQPFTIRTVGFDKSADSTRNASYPSLEKRMKGAHCKQLVMALCEMVVAVFLSGADASEYSRLRAVCAWNFYMHIHTLTHAPLLLDDIDAKSAHGYGWGFLEAYHKLAVDAYRDKLLKYKLRPKFHYWSHVVDDLVVTYMNPLRCDSFIFEDMCGKVKKMCRSCHPKTLSLRCAQRVLLMLAMRWRKHRLQ